MINNNNPNSTKGGFTVNKYELCDHKTHQNNLTATDSVVIEEGTTVIGTIRAPTVALINCSKITGDIYTDNFITDETCVHDGKIFRFSP